MLVCIYEDRHTHIPGLKLLLLSLVRHAPSWPVYLCFPKIPERLKIWLRRIPLLSLHDEITPFGGSYNVKPWILTRGLNTGATSCLWFDTDILINGSVDFLSEPPPSDVVVAQDPWEYPHGSTNRAMDWGLSPGRDLPGALNSAVLRVATEHGELLREWSELLMLPRYLAQQKIPIVHRNGHMLGDQDALSALLASAPFSKLAIRKLLHPTQILQHAGPAAYSISQRLATLRTGIPPILHAMGSTKPWLMAREPDFKRTPRAYYERMYLELSPYLSVARTYADNLEEADLHWLEKRTAPGKFFGVTGFKPQLAGLTQSVLHQALATVRSRKPLKVKGTTQ